MAFDLAHAYARPMQLASHSNPRMVVLALAFLSGCSPGHQEDPNMKPTGLEADPHFYKLNSVTGSVLGAGDRAVPGATITIVGANERVPVEPSGVFVLVLDPKRLGTDTHELLFSAPGYEDQRHTVKIPTNNQVRLDVVLAKKR